MEARISLKDIVGPITRANALILRDLFSENNEISHAILIRQFRSTFHTVNPAEMAVVRDRVRPLALKSAMDKVTEAPKSQMWSDFKASIGLDENTGPENLSLTKLIEILYWSIVQNRLKEAEVIACEIVPKYQNESWEKLLSIPEETSGLLSDVLLRNQPFLWKTLSSPILGLIPTPQFAEKFKGLLCKKSYSDYQSTMEALCNATNLTSPCLLTKTRSLIAVSGLYHPADLRFHQLMFTILDRVHRGLFDSAMDRLTSLAEPVDSKDVATCVGVLKSVNEFLRQFWEYNLCPMILYQLNPSLGDELFALTKVMNEVVKRRTIRATKTSYTVWWWAAAFV